MCVSHSVVSDSLRLCGLWPARLLCPWDFPSKNTGVGCHFLLQGIFLTQGSNLPHCRLILYCLSHQGNHRILKKKNQTTTTKTMHFLFMSLKYTFAVVCLSQENSLNYRIIIFFFFISQRAYR